MKTLLNIVGILLIIFGIAVLGYQGYFTYTSRDTVAQIGNVEVTADTQKTVYLSPVTGAIAVAAGVVLVILGRRK